MSAAKHPHIVSVSEEARTTPLELFFDLVFVFAITQVSALMDHDPTPHGLIRGVLVLAVVWWCWVGYAWLGSVLQADEGLGRVAMLGAMAATF
ncbi:MAG: low temperature requirement protein A, partial [Actinomycetota bacterium]